jgi:hypothetical protein
VVLHCYAVEFSIVLDKSEVTGLLFDKKDGQGHRRFRQDNIIFF